jgi:two-component system, chemotaxis family, CheB/CheR fusion protein
MLPHEVRGANKDAMKLAPAREQVSRLNTDVRLISHRLHLSTLNDLGQPAVSGALMKEFGHRENMPATFTIHHLPDNWSSGAAAATYRIAQEALRNVSKHAGKTHVKMVLSGSETGLRLRVMDFSPGFDQEADTPAPGLGMISMQERARLAGDTTKVQSALGQGTTVIVDISLDRHA